MYRVPNCSSPSGGHFRSSALPTFRSSPEASNQRARYLKIMVSAQEDREIVDFLGSFSLLKEICDDDPIELAKLCLTDDSAIQIASKCFSAYHAIKEREHLNPSAQLERLTFCSGAD